VSGPPTSHYNANYHAVLLTVTVSD